MSPDAIWGVSLLEHSPIRQFKDAMAGQFDEHHHSLVGRGLLACIAQADATIDTLTGGSRS